MAMLSSQEKGLLGECDNIDPVKNFIKQSLEQKAEGETYYYDNVCKQLRDRDDPEMTYKVMISLASYASLFTSDPDTYRDLITSILSYDWRSDRKISIAFVNLVGCMVSSNATFLIPSFQMLVKSLVPTDVELAALNADSTDVNAASQGCDKQGQQDATTRFSGEYSLQGDLQQSHVESLRERGDRIHKTLQGLVRLAPTGQAELHPVLEACFPHKRFSKGILSEYVAQILLVTEYLPSMQESVLDLVVSRCLEIDVEIVIEDTGEVRIQEEYTGETEEGMFHMDGEEQVSPEQRVVNGKIVSGGGKPRSGSVNNERTQRIPQAVTEMADKLDSILVVLIRYIDRQMVVGSDKQDRLLHHLLSVFERQVLFTYRSKFVQFVYFYVAQSSEKFAAGFCERLVRVFLEANGSGFGQHSSFPSTDAGFGPPAASGGRGVGGAEHALGSSGMSNMKVQSAVLYLASYLARARFISRQSVYAVLQELILWSDRYVVTHGAVATSYALSRPYASVVGGESGSGSNNNPGTGGGSTNYYPNGSGGSYTRTKAVVAGTGSNESFPASEPAVTRKGGSGYTATTSSGGNGKKRNKRSLSITDYRDNEDGGDSSDDDSGESRDDDDGSSGHIGAPITHVYDNFGRRRPVAAQVVRHETFYTCMQACCYIACFYGVELGMLVKGSEALRLAWERALGSTLAPLKYCLQSIRGEFLRLADACELFSGYFWAGLPPDVLVDSPHLGQGLAPPKGVEDTQSASASGNGNSSSSGSRSGLSLDIPVQDSAVASTSQPSTLSSGFSPDGKPPPAPSPRVSIGVGNGVGRNSGSVGGIAYARLRKLHPNAAGHSSGGSTVKMGAGSNPLESFFPFDPCLLELVHQYVGHHYRRWMGVPGIDVDAKYPYMRHSSITSDGQEMLARRPARTGTFDSTADSCENTDDSSGADLRGMSSRHAEYYDELGSVSHGKEGGGGRLRDELDRDDKERGQTVTSLASSISSVMSLAEGYSAAFLDGSNNPVSGIDHGTDRDDDEDEGDDDDASVSADVQPGVDSVPQGGILGSRVPGSSNYRPRLYSVGSTDSW